MKELPKVFANKIDKILNNNKNISYGELREAKNTPDRNTLNKKIAALFESNNIKYSYNCKIVFLDHVEKHIIIGKTDSYLVTRKEELIPIDKIIDIELN